MREIKFRGYDKNYKKWCYGSLMAGWDGQWYIEFYINRSLQKYRVDVNSIGQYTGFKDKNGKEIYEGDIVEYETSDEMDTYINKAEVYFDDELGAWEAHEKREEEVDSDIRLYSMNGKVEVIGNVYEEKQKGNKKGI